MAEPTLEDVDRAFAAISSMVDDFIEFPSRERAASLIAKCREYVALCRGRFANVGEQFLRVAHAAKGYNKSRDGNGDLAVAVMRIGIAINVHRAAAQL